VRVKGTKLGEGCPKIRLSQDRMPIFPPSKSLAPFGNITYIWDCYVRDCYVRDCYVRDCYVRDCYVWDNYVVP
jgi:hypothetical protein